MPTAFTALPRYAGCKRKIKGEKADMQEKIKELMEATEVLCERLSDSPCGCDACPYGDYEEQCHVYDVIGEIRKEIYSN